MSTYLTDKIDPNSGRHDPDAKSATIYVNTTPKIWDQKKITFEQVLALAFDPVPAGPNWEFTVTYRKGGDNSKPEGSLQAGEAVKVKNGMTFNATATDKS